MNFIELLLLGVGLAMDAFAVSVCKGLAMKKITWKEIGIIGLWFGGFQAFMPWLGYILGNQFKGYIIAIDHWIAFILLSIIGGSMIKEALDDECDNANPSLEIKLMFGLAVATSIDALAIGVTFAFLNVSILMAITIIGVVTFIISGVGVRIGNIFGTRYKSKAELAGGCILIFLGIRILLTHLGVL